MKHIATALGAALALGGLLGTTVPTAHEPAVRSQHRIVYRLEADDATPFDVHHGDILVIIMDPNVTDPAPLVRCEDMGGTLDTRTGWFCVGVDF